MSIDWKSPDTAPRDGSWFLGQGGVFDGSECERRSRNEKTG